MAKREQIEELINRLKINEDSGCKGIMLIDTNKKINLMTCEMTKKLGEGKFGKAFLLKCDGKEYVIKQICAEYTLAKEHMNKYGNEFYKDEKAFALKHPKMVSYNTEKLQKAINNEVKSLELVSELKVGPKVYDSWICTHCGYIVMEKLDMTLKDFVVESMKYYYLRNDLEGAVESIKKVNTLIEELEDKKRKNKLAIEDIHSENVMIKFKNNKTEDLFKPSNLESIKHIDLGMGAGIIKSNDKNDLNMLERNLKAVRNIFRGFRLWILLASYSNESKFNNFAQNALKESLNIDYNKDIISQYKDWFSSYGKYVELKEEDYAILNSLKQNAGKKQPTKKANYDTDSSSSDDDEPTKKKPTKKQPTKKVNYDTDSSSSDDDEPTKKKPTKKQPTKKVNYDTDSSSSDDDERPKKQTTKKQPPKKVNYDTDSSSSDDDEPPKKQASKKKPSKR